MSKEKKRKQGKRWASKAPLGLFAVVAIVSPTSASPQSGCPGSHPTMPTAPVTPVTPVSPTPTTPTHTPMMPTVAPATSPLQNATIGAPLPQVLPMAGINVVPQVNNAGIQQSIGNPNLINGRNPSALPNITPGATIQNNGYLLGGTKTSFDDEFQSSSASNAKIVQSEQDRSKLLKQITDLAMRIADLEGGGRGAAILEEKEKLRREWDATYQEEKKRFQLAHPEWNEAVGEQELAVPGYAHDMAYGMWLREPEFNPEFPQWKKGPFVFDYKYIANQVALMKEFNNHAIAAIKPIKDKIDNPGPEIDKQVKQLKIELAQLENQLSGANNKNQLQVVSGVSAGAGAQSGCATKCPDPSPHSTAPIKVVTAPKTDDPPKAKVDPAKLAQLKQQYADALKNDSAKFNGKDGDKFYGPDPKFATDLANVVKNYPNIDFTVPSQIPVLTGILPTRDNNFDIEFTQNQPPSVSAKQGNPYATATVDIQDTLKNSILNSDGNLTPADVMKLALDASNGNYALAVLAANNLLKEVAKTGRDDQAYISKNLDATNFTDPNNANFDKTQSDMADKVRQFDADANLAGKLISMRNAPGDKMGEWYHAFTILSMQVVTDSAGKAESLATGEQVLRTTRGLWQGTESPVDPEKRVSDFNFVTINYMIQDHQHPVLAVLTYPMEPRGPIDTVGMLVNKGYRLYDWATGTSSDYGSHTDPSTNAIHPTEPINSIFHPIPGGSYKPPLGKKFD